MSILSKLADAFRSSDSPVAVKSPDKMPISQFFEAEYRPRRLLTASPSTMKVYSITLKRFSQFLGFEARLCDLTDTIVASFAEHRLTVVKRGTVKRDLDQLLAIWRFAHTAGLLPKGPLMRNISVPTPTPIALTREQLADLWNAIQEHARPVVINCRPRVEVEGRLWWSAIYLLAWDTGERFNPIFELTESNLDLAGKWARFPAHDRKGGTADNLKPLADDTVKALEALLACYANRRGDSRVFRWAVNRSTVWTALGRIMKAAGLPDSREFKFHAIRKSSVSHLVAAGGDGRAHAGHSSDKVTRDHYCDPRIVGGQHAPKLLFRPGSLATEGGGA